MNLAPATPVLGPALLGLALLAGCGKTDSAAGGGGSIGDAAGSPSAGGGRSGGNDAGSGGSGAGSGGAAGCATFELTDPQLDAAVRAELGLAAGTPYTQANVAALVRVYAEQVQSLGGAECLSTLSELRLARSNVSDLSPLAGLSALRTLSNTEGPLTSIAPLVGLGELRALVLKGTEVADVSVVSHFTRLAQLNLAQTPVFDLSPLAELHELTELDVSGTQTPDLSAIPAPASAAQQPCLYALGLSPSAVPSHVAALCAEGWVVSWSATSGEHGVCNGTCGK
ncbi:MAG: hypothetical protein ABJB12_11800 [Pseudomonadota bacterium]